MVMCSPVVVPLVSFASRVKLDGTKLQETFLQFPSRPVEPVKKLISFPSSKCTQRRLSHFG